MGNLVSVRIEGVESLIRNMEGLTEKIKGKAVTRALLDGAEIIGNDAKQRAPVLKSKETVYRMRGALRSGITWYPLSWDHVIVRVRNKGNPKFKRAGQRSLGSAARNPWYWWHVEFGTKHAAAQPFLRPAFEAKKREALEAIVKALRTPIHTAARLLSKRRRR